MPLKKVDGYTWLRLCYFLFGCPFFSCFCQPVRSSCSSFAHAAYPMWVMCGWCGRCGNCQAEKEAPTRTTLNENVSFSRLGGVIGGRSVSIDGNIALVERIGVDFNVTRGAFQCSFLLKLPHACCRIAIIVFVFVAVRKNRCQTGRSLERYDIQYPAINLHV